MYLILLKQRSAEGFALWWRPSRSGYTTDTAIAGRYSEEEALSIKALRGEDFPVPENALGRSLVTRTVVSVEDYSNFENLKAFQADGDSEHG